MILAIDKVKKLDKKYIDLLRKYRELEGQVDWIPSPTQSSVDLLAGNGSWTQVSGGDMLKSTYDSDNNGIVEPAQLNLSGKADSGHNHTKGEIEAVLTGEISSHSHAGGGQAFPIGSVFLAVVSTNPATLLGYGTWTQISQGKFLVGQDSTDTDFDVAEETGGAKTHTHVAHSEYSHSQNTASPKWWDTVGGDSKPDAHPTQSHDSPNHLPPYFVVYIWKRTA